MIVPSKTLLNAAASVIGAGTSSSCTGPDLKDNVKVAPLLLLLGLSRDDFLTQSLIVMPGCTLEVWDKDSNPESKKERPPGSFLDNLVSLVSAQLGQSVMGLYIVLN